MKDFMFWLPTRIRFGKGMISRLDEMRENGSKVLLVYGSGSIVRNGIYDIVKNRLQELGIAVFELSGVEPNPKVNLVRQGVAVCRERKIDMILAVGGGSVIDSAKMIAAGTRYMGDVWELMLNAKRIQDALPVYTVPTVAASGSEMNPNAVICDPSAPIKRGVSSVHLYPVMSICDPSFTFSVSVRQTAAGIADMMSHTFENYFTNAKGNYLQAGFSEALLRTCIRYGPIALKDQNDYEARANLMWCSINAINGIARAGAQVSWSCHPIEQELSAFYGITHGEGLAILIPHWMRFALNADTASQFAALGENVWGISGNLSSMQRAKLAVEKTETFFYDVLQMPRKLSELGVHGESLEAVADRAALRCASDTLVPMKKEDILTILQSAL